jgi:LPXTG-site transpeptidase (sortase) family protein
VFEPCTRPTYSGEPTLVRIPAIAVESSLESLSLDPAGQLEPPKTYERAGWWRGGVVPGDIGPAVIAGHVDSVKGPAVFYRLHELRRGDIVEVVRGGQVVTFTVTGAEQYPKDAFPTDRVYQPTPDAELRLITCGGDFDRRRRSYRDNIVIYAALA